MTTIRKRLNLQFKHAHGDLEDDCGTVVEEEVPEAQQDLHVHHAGKQRQEPVQRDQGQLWNQHATHIHPTATHALKGTESKMYRAL